MVTIDFVCLFDFVLAGSQLSEVQVASSVPPSFLGDSRVNADFTDFAMLGFCTWPPRVSPGLSDGLCRSSVLKVFALLLWVYDKHGQLECGHRLVSIHTQK